jgi:hypothetical protein
MIGVLKHALMVTSFVLVTAILVGASSPNPVRI